MQGNTVVRQKKKDKQWATRNTHYCWICINKLFASYIYICVYTCLHVCAHMSMYGLTKTYQSSEIASTKNSNDGDFFCDETKFTLKQLTNTTKQYKNMW